MICHILGSGFSFLNLEYILYFSTPCDNGQQTNFGRMNFDCLLVPDLNLFLNISVNSSFFLLEKTKIKISGTCTVLSESNVT